MAFTSHRARFKGNLAGVSIEEVREIDYTIDNFKDRLKYLNSKHEKIKGFFSEYIFTEKGEDEYYKVNISSKDDLSSEINIFKYLEADASYLINSPDLERDRQQKYKILSEEEFKKVLAREKSLQAMQAQELDGDSEVMEVLAPKEANDYTNMNHKITKADLLDEECGAVLSCYDKARNYLKEEMEKCKNKSGSTMSLYQIKKILQTINDDMILAKIQLKGIRSPAKKLGDIGSCPSYDDIDYTNPSHVKFIIKMVRFGELQPDSMLSHLAYDMEVAIKELFASGAINDTDMEVVECFNAGYTLQAIGDELGIKKQSVDERLKKVFKKISKYYLTKC